MKGKNSLSNTEIERLKKIERVADEVIEKIGNPVSPLQVSAVIESLGYRHADCPTEFGKKNIFELSKDVYKICKLKVKAGKLRGRKAKQPDFIHSLWIFVRYFSAGIALGLPIASQIAFIAFTGYSLWAWIKFTELQATIVALGTILSFIITGGFTQVMGREITYYLSIENKVTAREIAFKLFNYGSATSIAFGLLLFILNLVFEIFPQKFFFNSPRLLFSVVNTLAFHKCDLFSEKKTRRVYNPFNWNTCRDLAS
jgi:hypothetical protein